MEVAGLRTAADVTNPGCPKFPTLRAFNRSLGRIWQVKVREGGGFSAAPDERPCGNQQRADRSGSTDACRSGDALSRAARRMALPVYDALLSGAVIKESWLAMPRCDPSWQLHLCLNFHPPLHSPKFQDFATSGLMQAAAGIAIMDSR